MAELDIDIQSFDISRIVSVYPKQMEVYHNAIEQTKEQLLKQINMI